MLFIKFISKLKTKKNKLQLITSTPIKKQMLVFCKIIKDSIYITPQKQN